MSLFINTENCETVTPPIIKGYCFFIDIVGSTKMKYKATNDWMSLFAHTFSTCRQLVGHPVYVLKYLGDCIMVFVKESETKESPLSYLSELLIIVQLSQEKYNAPVKMSACYCDKVYDMTFDHNNDVYGLEIDLAARLLNQANEHQMVINDEYYRKIMTWYQATGNKAQFDPYLNNLQKISRPLNGIQGPTDYYVYTRYNTNIKQQSGEQL